MTEAIAKRPSGLDLQYKRKAAGLTQDQVAASLGVTRQRIAAIEGARFPSLKATEQFLDALVRVAAGDGDAPDGLERSSNAMFEAGVMALEELAARDEPAR